MLSPKEQEYTRATIAELISLKKSFTGEDVLKRMNSKYVRGRSERFSCASSAKDVSSFVRSLFNSGDMTFFGSKYGSAPSSSCNTFNGPLMFFPLPSYAKRNFNKIIQTLPQPTQSS